MRVKDRGVGIEPHMLEAVFEHFVQQRQSLERSHGGLGLGLAIVKNLVTLHGGTVRAESEGPGCGSQFVVELPLAAAEASAPDAPTLEATGALPSAAEVRVLVVDDNEDAAAMLAEGLAELGYTVRTASDGPSALELAATFRPRVALLDIGLPVMDGYELGRLLRATLSESDLRLVALTGYGQASDRARSRDAGFDAHLVKPIRLEEIQQLLEKLRSQEAAATHG